MCEVHQVVSSAVLDQLVSISIGHSKTLCFSHRAKGKMGGVNLAQGPVCGACVVRQVAAY